MNNVLIGLAGRDKSLYQIGWLRWLLRAVILIFILFAFAFSQNTSTSQIYLGLILIILPFEISLDIYRLFIRGAIGIEEARAVSIAHKGGQTFTYEVALLLLDRPVDGAHIWLSVLNSNAGNFAIRRMGIAPSDLAAVPCQPAEAKTVIEQAEKFASLRHEPLAIRHIFEVWQSIQPNLTTFWQSKNIDQPTRDKVWDWYYFAKQQADDAARGWGIESVGTEGGIAQDWSSGFRPTLDQYASDVTKEIVDHDLSINVIGHENELKTAINYLVRDFTHNALLVGDDGVGRQQIIFTIADMIAHGKVPPAIAKKHVFRLDIGRVISGVDQATVEQRLGAICNEAIEAGNIILVVEDIDLLLSNDNQNIGKINARAMLLPYLASPKLQFIATITTENYHKYIEADEELAQSLLSVPVHEIGPDDVIRILEQEVFRYEAKTGYTFSYQALERIVEIATQRIHDRPFPDKAIRFLETIASRITLTKGQIVTPDIIDKAAGDILKTPIGATTATERDQLMSLEETIGKRLVGQLDAVKAVANALRRARAGLTSGKKPIGTFLFLGPTGVGKTEMTKTVAALYYGSEKSLIRLDMSEYQNPEDIKELIGDGTNPGRLSSAVRDNPYSLILLDEIEKADPGIRNLFLQILDEGRATDGLGKLIDFTQSMIIATSNAGAEMIREHVEKGEDDATFKNNLLTQLQVQGTFTPEWLNRFDAIVIFKPLTRDEIKEVAKRMIANLQTSLTEHNVVLTVADDALDKLVDLGYDPQYGARPMSRAIADHVEDAIAKQVISSTSNGPKNITLTAADLVG